MNVEPVTDEMLRVHDFHVYPTFSLIDTDDSVQEEIILPGLHDIISLDLDSRRQIFAAALG